jgi:signal transduction histidine kinase
MRTMLLLSLLSIPCGVVSLSLVVLHNVLQTQIRRELAADLDRSVSTFRNIQAQREQMLTREVSLLAALPVLKSLMSSSDDNTIRDGAAEFYALSGGDLFGLADREGRPVAVFESGKAQDPAELTPPIAFSDSDVNSRFYLTRSKHLYEVAYHPVYFGPDTSGIRLGYVLLGFTMGRRLADEVSQAASAQVIFLANGKVAASTLGSRYVPDVDRLSSQLSAPGGGGLDAWFAGEHFIHASLPLAGGGSGPVVEMVALKSYDKASQYVTRLNLSLLLLGAVLLVLSGSLAVYLSTSITRPLDRLVAGARALGSGNFDYQLQHTGTREIRELGEAFDRMRNKLRAAREELLAAERLATIGRMASSISHDLRHYLAAVYANAEFLGYDSTRPEERHELIGEVRQGVRGMTDLIESLLLFSRTGEALQLSCESLSFLIERAVTLVKAHPDAQNVRFTVAAMPQIDAWLDARKVERALYNLLLNACQASRETTRDPEVRIVLAEGEERITFFIVDNGPGVPESVRQSLFQPFVSVGKASGTGLGLTLSLKIAQEHGGTVLLADSRDGVTVFQLTLGKAALGKFAETAQRRETPVSLN